MLPSLITRMRSEFLIIKSLRDDEGRPPPSQIVYGLLDRPLSPGIHGVGGLVEDQQRGAVHHGASDGHLLFLPGKQCDTVQHSIVADQEGLYEVV